MDLASGSPALLSEVMWALRGMVSGALLKLSLLVFMLMLTIFPEPVNSGLVRV